MNGAPLAVSRHRSRAMPDAIAMLAVDAGLTEPMLSQRATERSGTGGGGHTFDGPLRLTIVADNSDVHRRRAIYVDGLAHGKNPIPVASVVDGILYSGGVTGRDPVTAGYAADIVGQSEQLFENIAAILAAAGGDMGDVVKIDVWLAEAAERRLLNSVWERWFPDPADRPARKAEFDSEMGEARIRCQFVAVLRRA
jgi:2-iminobutanoate/2-iminopropanoate deaminase